MLSYRVKTLIIAIGMVLGLALGAKANEPICDYMTKDSKNQVTIYQPEALRERLMADTIKHEEEKTKRVNSVGYRIQVYSDNNQRTARSEAKAKERNIITRFPQLRSYISYKAPQWRLRVGDFRTREEARAVMRELRHAFPSYASEMTIVMDRINPSAL